MQSKRDTIAVYAHRNQRNEKSLKEMFSFFLSAIGYYCFFFAMEFNWKKWRSILEIHTRQKTKQMKKKCVCDFLFGHHRIVDLFGYIFVSLCSTIDINLCLVFTRFGIYIFIIILFGIGQRLCFFVKTVLLLHMFVFSSPLGSIISQRITM